MPDPSRTSGSQETADWQRLLGESTIDPAGLAQRFRLDVGALAAVVERYPVRITPHYLSLIGRPEDPIGRQAIPTQAEIADHELEPDPTGEEEQSPAPTIVHRYPDRVLFRVSDQCAVYCRFCLRKRRVGKRPGPSEADLDSGLAYIAENPSVEEVILSGGDPLMLTDERLARLLVRLRAIDHVRIIRIHSRMPCTLPQRITPSLTALLSRYHPLFLMTHFNHPAELTSAAAQACSRLAAAGIPLGCQTVLLRGVNDTPEVMGALMKGLVRVRIRPYYLHHPDPVRGTAHFRVPVSRGLEIMERLRGRISGLSIPQYMIDLPGSGGKVPVLPGSVRRVGAAGLEIVNYEGRRFVYPDP